MNRRHCYAFAVQYYASCGDLDGVAFNFLGLLVESIPKREGELSGPTRRFEPCTVAGLRKDTAGICTLSGPSDHTIRFSTFQ